VHGPPPDDALDDHRLRVRAAMGHLSSQAVVSHVSAAVLHGLPIRRVPLGRVQGAGLPTPELQGPVPGTPYEVDFAGPDLATVGEFDGRVEYGRTAAPGRDRGEVAFGEKRREDVLRDRTLWVVRWTWIDLDAFDPIAHRLRHRLRR
jgi:hypothetical protein